MDNRKILMKWKNRFQNIKNKESKNGNYSRRKFNF